MAYLLHHVLPESTVKNPVKTAIVWNDDAITYAELERESNKLAHTLAALGVRRGDHVGIFMDKCIASIAAAFGVLKAGAAYVPLDPACPPGRIHYIVNKSRMKCMLASRKKMAAIEAAFPVNTPLETVLTMNGRDDGFTFSGQTKLIDWHDLREAASGDATGTNTVDTDLAYILFTSGSTGNPKGVMISHLNALTFVNSAHDFFQISAHDRFSHVCPLHFDMSVFDLFVAFKAGATVVVIPETDAMFPVKLAKVIAKNGISVWNSVPSALSLLATYKNLDARDLASLRLVFFAGEPFPLKYLRRLRTTVPGARFCNMYGQTEANSSTYYWVDQIPEDDRATLPIGRALPNFDVFALDEDSGRVIEPGQEGELYVRASTVAMGYLGDVEKTEKAFVKNPVRPDLNERVYRTGDLVRLNADGNYMFLGRKDHMIKSRGYRIEIGEIETVLCSHSEVKNAVVIPVPDGLIGNRIWAIVVPFMPGALNKEDVVSYCSRQLPKYMIPEIIELRDSLPVTSSGKVDRKKLSDSTQQLFPGTNGEQSGLADRF